MPRFHFRSIVAMLDNHCHRVSLKGLKEDYGKKEVYDTLKETCLNKELYGILEAMENRDELIDELNFIYVTKVDRKPVVIMKQEHYMEDDIVEICKLALLPLEVFEEFKEVKPA